MAAKTISLKGQPFRKEYLAGAGITPGHLIALASTGKVVVHPTTYKNAQKMFALEDPYRASASIDTAYVADDTCYCGVCSPGDEIYALIPASAPAIVIGDALCSNGDGTVIKWAAQAVDEAGSATFTLYDQAIIGYALEAVDNSSGGTVVRLKIESA